MRLNYYGGKCFMALSVLSLLILFILSGTAEASMAEARVKLEQAKLIFSDGRYAEAIELLNEVIDEDPQSTGAYAYLGLCQMAVGDFSSAVQSFEKTVTLDPAFTEGYVNLAWARLEDGQADAALEDAQTALDKDPDNGFGVYIMGRAKADLGRCDDAGADFEQAVSLMPEIEQAAGYYLGACYDEAGQTELAEQTLQQAWELDPDSELGKRSAVLIARVDEAVAPAAKEPFTASVKLLYQYDTNVFPVHEEDYFHAIEDAEDIENEGDHRGVVILDLVARPVQTAQGSVTLRYNFYAGFHDEIEQMNMINNLVLAAADIYGSIDQMPTRSYLALYVASTHLDYEPFMKSYEVRPGLEIMETDTTMTRIDLPFGYQYYEDPEVLAEPYKSFPSFRENDYNRDNKHYGIDISQYFLYGCGQASFVIGARYIVKEAEGDNYDHVITGGHVGLTIEAVENLLLTAKARYEQHDYSNSDWDSKNIIYLGGPNEVSRKDLVTRLSFSVQYQVTDNLATYLGLLYIDNHSNVVPLDYERTIYSAGLIGSTDRVIPAK